MHNIDRIRQALASCHLSWADLCASTEGIILFGSQAAGCSRQDSDVDLLCLGDGLRRSSSELHLVWIAPESLSDHRWLSSEFGGHVAKYGVWLTGGGSFSTVSPPSQNAMARKLRFIADRAEMLTDEWEELSRRFRVDQVRKLRRDVQRLRILSQGEPVPPTPLLDSQWVHEKEKRRFVERAFTSEQHLGRVVATLVGSMC